MSYYSDSTLHWFYAATCYGDAAGGYTPSRNISSGTDHGTGDFSYGLSHSFSATNRMNQVGKHSGTGFAMATSNSTRYTTSVIASKQQSVGNVTDDWPHNLCAHGTYA